MPEAPSLAKLVPHWEVGQTWRVEYQTWQPSPEKGIPHAPAPPLKSVWRYEVLPPEPGSTDKILSLKQEGGKRVFRMTFDPHDLALRSVTEIVRGRSLPVVENPPHQSWFGYNQGQGVIFDWPIVEEGNQNSEFKTAQGTAVQQRVTDAGTDRFKVQMQSKDEPDPGFVEITTSSQTWKRGLPWWSQAAVQVDYDEKGEKSSLVFIEGKLLP